MKRSSSEEVILKFTQKKLALQSEKEGHRVDFTQVNITLKKFGTEKLGQL